MVCEETLGHTTIEQRAYDKVDRSASAMGRGSLPLICNTEGCRGEIETHQAEKSNTSQPSKAKMAALGKRPSICICICICIQYFLITWPGSGRFTSERQNSKRINRGFPQIDSVSAKDHVMKVHCTVTESCLSAESLRIPAQSLLG
jgi:hypothetical protein